MNGAKLLSEMMVKSVMSRGFKYSCKGLKENRAKKKK